MSVYLPLFRASAARVQKKAKKRTSNLLYRAKTAQAGSRHLFTSAARVQPQTTVRFVVCRVALGQVFSE
jgi:hypothetical protein